MKLGVSTYSFSRLINSGKLDQLKMIETVKEMGFQVIEFAGLNVPENESSLSFAAKIKEKCESVNLEIGNYTIGADFLNSKLGHWSKEVERLKEEIKIANALGCSGMRHDATYGLPADFPGVRSFENALPTLIKGCQAVTEFGEEYNIRTMVENHGFFCQDSIRIEQLVNGVNHPNFGVLLDIGNFLCVDENPTEAIGRLMPYVFHVHAKDFHYKSGNEPNPGFSWFKTRGGNYLRGSIIGHGHVPILQCLQLIKDKGYNNVVAIEFEGIEEPLLGIKEGLSNLQRYLKLLDF